MRYHTDKSIFSRSFLHKGVRSGTFAVPHALVRLILVPLLQQKKQAPPGLIPTAPLLECEFIPPVLSCQDAGRKFVGPNQNAGETGQTLFSKFNKFFACQSQKEREAFLKK